MALWKTTVTQVLCYLRKTFDNLAFSLKAIFVFAGFSIEGGTRRLIAAYFGIYSRLLCV